MENNECIGSVIYVPYHKKMYVAERGTGSFIMDDVSPDADAEYTYSQIYDRLRRLPLSQPSRDEFRVAVSRSHQTPETHAHIDTLRADHPNLTIVEQGSSYKFCLLAEGEVDYYIRTTQTYEWGHGRRRVDTIRGWRYDALLPRVRDAEIQQGGSAQPVVRMPRLPARPIDRRSASRTSYPAAPPHADGAACFIVALPRAAHNRAATIAYLSRKRYL